MPSGWLALQMSVLKRPCIGSTTDIACSQVYASHSALLVLYTREPLRTGTAIGINDLHVVLLSAVGTNLHVHHVFVRQNPATSPLSCGDWLQMSPLRSTNLR